MGHINKHKQKTNNSNETNNNKKLKMKKIEWKIEVTKKS